MTCGSRGRAATLDSAKVTLRSLVDRYVWTHQMAGNSPHTDAYYKGILGRFLWYGKQAGWPEDSYLLTEWHIREFLGYVGTEVNRWGVKGNGAESSSRRASPRTVHHYYRVLTAFFNWAVREGFIAESPLSKVTIVKARRKVIRPYTQEQIERMLAVCDREYERNRRFIASRNRAIILVALDTGLRLGELANIRLSGINMENGWIRVTGKGGKERVVRIGQLAQTALQQYYEHRTENGRDELWLTGKGRSLKTRGLQIAFQRIKQRAGITDSGGCHRMRHTFAISFLRADGNVFNLQYILGHTSLEMVRIYTATLGVEDALRAHIEASPADHLGYSLPEIANKKDKRAGRRG